MLWIYGGVGFLLVVVGSWLWSFRKKPYRRPWRIHFTYWFTSYTWQRWFGLILLSILSAIIVGGSILLIWLVANQVSAWINSTGTSNPVDQSTILNVVAALAGALIGAIVAGVISISLQSQEFLSQSVLRRKVDIYEPLYSGLKQFREQITNEYPHRYVTDSTKLEETDEIPYIVWTVVRSGELYLYVPKWLKGALDRHWQELNEYFAIKEKARHQAYQIVKNVLLHDHERPFEIDAKPAGYSRNYRGMPNRMLTELIEARPQNAPEYFRTNMDSGDEPFSTMFLDASAESLKLPEVQSLIAHQRNIVTHTDWLLKELKTLIGFITRRYEGQGDLY